jgi:hypothetical protein
VEDERRSCNGVGRSKQDERQMGTTDGLGPMLVDIWVHAVIKGAQIQYDEVCSSVRAEDFMASFKYRGDASAFTSWNQERLVIRGPTCQWV